MAWSTFLYILSILTLGLGIYMAYQGRNSIKIYRQFLFMSVDMAIWFASTAAATGSRSPLVTTAAFTIIEITIYILFPLITWYIAGLTGKKRYIQVILRLKIAAAVLMILLILFQGYWKAEYINGQINLVL
ncbi:MAG: hypothetical protein LBR99_00425, partial [Treponema sp.]|nr:hypothetical protein [Treponema sp.]